MPSVLSILLATYFVPRPTDADVDAMAFGLRLYAAALLVYIIHHFAEFYPTLKSRVVATLIQPLLLDMDDGTADEVPNASGSFDAKLGALLGLRRLGPSSFKTLLGPVPVQSGVPRTNEHAEVVPFKAMSSWMEDGMKSDSVSPSTKERLIHEIKAGLRELQSDTIVPDDKTLAALETMYGSYWVHALHDDNELLAVLTHYHTLIGS